MALKVKQALKDEGSKLLVGTAGLITEAKQARDSVQGSLMVLMIAFRYFNS